MSNEFDDILAEYDKEVELLCRQELDRVGKKIEAKLKQKVIKNNRLNFIPRLYRRTGQLVNSISTFKGNNEVIVSWKDLEYETKGNINSNDIPQMLEHGWGDQNAFIDNYRNRRPENFVKEACQEIISEEGNIAEIIEW